MAQNKTGLIMTVLLLLVIILGAMVLYAFVVKPTFSGYIVDAQNQGINYTINIILNQLQQQRYVALPVGNQTLYLAPFNPQQAQALQNASG